MNIRKSDKGFTIIEVVIVLAIAGLIFAIVFWALPNLQKNQRDGTRRQVVGNVLANLDQFASNTNNYPDDATSWNSFLDAFYGCVMASPLTPSGTDPCELVDPLEDEFLASVQIRATTDDDVVTVSDSDPIGTLVFAQDGQCDSDGIGWTEYGGGRAIAIVVRLENGVAYCLDNS